MASSLNHQLIDDDDNGDDDIERIILMKKFGLKHNDIRQVETRRQAIASYREPSLWGISPSNHIRAAAIRLVHARSFDMVMLVFIILNCISIAVNPKASYSDQRADNRGAITFWVDLIILILFAFEVVMKWLAMGIFWAGPRSYFRNWWNVADFFVVLIGFIYFIPGLDSDLLRLVRLLRPFKAVSSIRGLRTMVYSLVASLPPLASVASFLFCLVFLMGVFMVQMYAGNLRRRCVDSDGYLADGFDLENGPTCDHTPGGIFDGLTCPINTTCSLIIRRPDTLDDDNDDTTNGTLFYLDGHNPHYGSLGFDYLPQAMLMIIVSLSCEGWTEIMYRVGDTSSVLAYPLFCLLMILGAFLVIKFITAVLFIQFSNLKELHTKKELYRKMMKVIEGRKARGEWSHFGSGYVAPDSRTVSAIPVDVVVEARIGLGLTSSPSAAAIQKAGYTELVPRRSSTMMSPPHIQPVFMTTPNNDALNVPPLSRTISNDSSSDAGGSSNDSSVVNLTKEAARGTDAKSNDLSPTTDDTTTASSPQTDAHTSLASSQRTPAQQALIDLETLLTSHSFEKAAEGEEGEDQPSYIVQCGARLPSLPLSIQIPCRRLVLHPWFLRASSIIVLLNTAVLSGEYYGQPASEKDTLNAFNYIFTVFFICELILKLIGLGYSMYFVDNFNKFDFIVVTISVIDLAIDNDAGGLSALQAFRLLRIARALHGSSGMRKLLYAIYKTLYDLFFFSLVLGMFMFVATVIGRIILGGEMKDPEAPGYSVRNHFDTFWWASVTVFQVLTPENWNQVLFDVIHARGALGAVYLVLVYMLGNYIVLSLFLAILLSNFGEEEDEDDASKVDPFAAIAVDINGSSRNGGSSDDGDDQKSIMSDDSSTKEVADGRSHAGIAYQGSLPILLRQESDETTSDLLSSIDGGMRTATPPRELPGQLLAGSNPSLMSHFGTRTSSSRAVASGDDASMDGPPLSPNRQGPHVSRFELITAAERAVILPLARDHTIPHHRQRERKRLTRAASRLAVPITGLSCGCFGANSSLRQRAMSILAANAFDYLMLVVTIISCVTLMFEKPARADDPIEGVTDMDAVMFTLWLLNLLTTIIFAVESLIKFVAFGVFRRSHAYFRDPWNILEFVIVITSFIFLLSPNNGFATSTRSLRALRPLRLLATFRSTRKVFGALLGSFRQVFNVLLFGLLLWDVFAIVGVQFFSGKLQKCHSIPDGDVLSLLNQPDCITANHSWNNPLDMGNFDNVGAAMLVLFELSTQENWPYFMYMTVDATEPGQPPEREHNQYAAFYFVLAIIVCSFFYANLFVGAVCDAYETSLKQNTGEISDTANKWLAVYRTIVYHPPPLKMTAPKQFQTCGGYCRRGTVCLNVREWSYNVVSGHRFKWCIYVLIFISSVSVCLTFYDEQDDTPYKKILVAIDDVCSLFFLLEMAMKMTAYGPKQYLAAKWHRLDFFVAVMALLDLVTEPGLIPILPASVAFINVAFPRSMRLLRLLQILKMNRGLSDLMQTLRFAIPGMTTVGSLLGVMYFVYAIAAMNLFGQVKDGNFLDEYANFRSFPVAVLTLFRATTGENWNGMMRDCMVEPPFCEPELHNCGSPVSSILFFVSFMIFSSFLLINLVVAIVINFVEEEFEATQSGQEDRAITSSMIVDFGTIWEKLSRGNGEVLQVSLLPTLLSDVRGVLAEGIPQAKDGFDEAAALRMAQLRFIDSIQIPSEQGVVHFIDVAYRLSQVAFARAHPKFSFKEVERISKDDEQLSLLLAGVANGYPSLVAKSPATGDDSNGRGPVTRRDPSLLAATSGRRRWRHTAGAVYRVLLLQRVFRGFRTRRAFRKLVHQMHQSSFVGNVNSILSPTARFAAETARRTGRAPSAVAAPPSPRRITFHNRAGTKRQLLANNGGTPNGNGNGIQYDTIIETKEPHTAADDDQPQLPTTDGASGGITTNNNDIGSSAAAFINAPTPLITRPVPASMIVTK